MSNKDGTDGKDNMIRFKDLKKQTGLSKSTILREEKAGRFPMRMLLSIKGVGWSQAEVNQWKAARKASRHAAAARRAEADRRAEALDEAPHETDKDET